MRTKLLQEAWPRIHAVVFETGDEVSEGLVGFARDRGITAAGLTAIGALRDVTLAFFDVEAKEYLEIPVEEQVEVLSLVGNLALRGGEPILHAHAVVGRRDGTTRGGHLLRATVRPTLEVVVTEPPDALQRTFDPDVGLPLIDL